MVRADFLYRDLPTRGFPEWGLHLYSNRKSPIGILLQGARGNYARRCITAIRLSALSCRQSPIGILLQAFSYSNYAAGILLERFSCRHSPVGILLQAFTYRHSPVCILLQALSCWQSAIGNLLSIGILLLGSLGGHALGVEKVPFPLKQVDLMNFR